MMKSHWMTAALLGALLSGACGGQNAQNTEETVPAETTAAVEPAPAPAAEPVSPPADTAPAVTPAPRPRPTTPSRPAPAASAAPAAPREAPAPAPAAAPAPRAPQYRTLRVPANTALALELLTPLSSETT